MAAHNSIDLTSQTFSRLTVLSRTTTQKKKSMWLCQCICGNQRIVAGKCLRNGDTKSCGCWSKDIRDARNFKHGMAKRGATRTKTYVAWTTMNKRCVNPRTAKFPRYGGRGIVVCERWKHSFPNFLADMGECPPGMSIERRDNDGNYEPSNCYWATPKEQANNTRRNRWLIFQGETRTLSDWAERVGIHRRTISSRLKMGWSIDQALTFPARKSH
jgi:hypothetical protein